MPRVALLEQLGELPADGDGFLFAAMPDRTYPVAGLAAAAGEHARRRHGVFAGSAFLSSNAAYPSGLRCALSSEAPSLSLIVL